MQVKKATFQRMGSGGKGRTENRWDVSGGQSAPSGVYFIIPKWVHQEVSGWPPERRQNCSCWHCTVLFCKQRQYLVLLYTSDPSRGVNTNCHSSLPCPLQVTVFWDLNAVCAELHGVSLKTVISLITLSSFTSTALTNTCTDKITLFPQNCQRHCTVKFNKR